MVAPTWTDADTTRACQIWEDYQRQHDVSQLTGKAAGIDPATGKVWFGDSAIDIVEQLEKDGESRPLYFVRVGETYYFRKGGRR